MRHLVLVLVLVTACVTPQTGRQSYAVAVGLYTGAANSMASYCGQLDKRQSDECIEARLIAMQAQLEIDTVTDALQNGTATESLLTQAAAAINLLRTQLAEKVQ